MVASRALGSFRQSLDRRDTGPNAEPHCPRRPDFAEVARGFPTRTGAPGDGFGAVPSGRERGLWRENSGTVVIRRLFLIGAP